MYKQTQPAKTDLKVNTSVRGETIEQKMERVVNNKEPIKDGAPIVYTDRKDGVIPEFDIRTDNWDRAIEATNKLHEAHISKRLKGIEARTPKEETSGSGSGTDKSAGGTSTAATDAK